MNELSGLTRTENRTSTRSGPPPPCADSCFEGATALADLSGAED
ncbi:hypothetical protein SAMN02745166_02210 [Prosthecobacter debontii]|uniref:Uncharacterized protein n=1 Tax=Prosthecobacter debontii TaxID=48467 RepID=A0A1T4XZ15_9BACT|nr:hypothetical protein SAMN02745166_02210 [Prosthecobacter debontii]